MNSSSPTHDFLFKLNEIDTEDTNALEIVAKQIEADPQIYKAAIKILKTNPFEIEKYESAIKHIQNHIIFVENRTCKNIRILKICADKNLGYTNLLPWAIQTDNLQLAKELIKAGFELNTPDAENVHSVQHLMGLEWDETTAEFADFLLNHPSLEKNVELLVAAIHNNKLEMVKAMLKAGFDVHARYNEAPYFYALKNFLEDQHKEDAIQMVSELIKAGGSDDVHSMFFQLYHHRMAVPPDAMELLKEVFLSQDFLQGITSKERSMLVDAWLCREKNMNSTSIIALLKQPVIVERFPNLMTILLRSLIENSSSLDEIKICLDAMPQLVNKQQGRALMCYAIENGHFLLARELCKRGFNPDAPYGAHLFQNDHNKDMSAQAPWYHALKKGRDDILELFLLSPKGKPKLKMCSRIYADLLDQPQVCEKHPKLLFKLIGLGVDSDTNNSTGQKLIDLIVALPEILPWPLVKQLLEKQPYLTAETAFFLFKKALSEGQLQVAELLNKRIPFEHMSHHLDHTLLNSLTEMGQQQCWVQSLLQEWVKEGLSIDHYGDKQGNTLLASVIQRRNFPLAAFLIKLGADLKQCKTSISELIVDQLQQYAAKLQTGSFAEQALRKELFTKNLAHLLGDSFMQDLGNLPSNSISFMLKIIDYFISDKPQDLTQDVVEKLKHFSKQLQHGLEVSHQLDDLRQLSAIDTKKTQLGINSKKTHSSIDPASPHLSIGLAEVAKHVQLMISELSEGETVWLPYGWSGNHHHAILIGCQRRADGIYFHVTNTGSGVQFHDLQHDLLRTYIDTVYSFKIPANKAEDPIFLQQLFEPAVLGMGIKKISEQDYNEHDIYSLLAPYAVSHDQESNLPSVWMHEQLGGGCSFRSLLAALSFTLGKGQYKKFNRLIKKEITTMALEQNGELMQIDNEVARILSQAFPRLPAHVAKGLDSLITAELLEGSEIDLAALKELHKKMQVAIPKAASENESLSYSPQIATRTSAVQASLKSRSATKPYVEDISQNDLSLTSQPPASLSKNSLASAKDLLTGVEEFAQYLEKSKKNSSNAITAQFLIDLGHILFTKNGEPRELLLGELKQRPEIVAKVLPYLSEIASKLYTETKYQALDSGFVSVALLSSFAVVWHLAGIAEENNNKTAPEARLSSYSPPCRDLMQPLFGENMPVFTPELEPDLYRVTNFLQKAGEGKKKTLCDYVFYYDNGNYHFRLEDGSGDYLYLQSHLKELSDNDRNKAIEALEVAMEPFLKRGFTQKFSKENWIINYCYVNDLSPPSYPILKRLAAMARLASPAMRSLRPPVKLYGPKIVRSDPNNPKDLTINYSMDMIASSCMAKQTKRDLSEFLPESSKKVGYSKDKEIPLISLHQNTIVTQYHGSKGAFHGLLSLNSPFESIQGAGEGQMSTPDQLIPITMLLDYFDSHLDELMEHDVRVFFALVQRKFTREALQQHQGEYIKFFDKASSHFEAQWLTNINTVASQQVLLFLLEQKQRFCRHADIAAIGKKNVLEETRQQIRKLISDPRMQKIEDQQYIYLILLDSYNSKDLLSSEQIAELVMVRAHLARLLQTSKNSPFLFPQLFEAAPHALAVHKDEIRTYLAEDPIARKNIFTNICQEAGIEFPLEEWVDNFPDYSSSHSDGTIFKVNILSGNIYQNGKNLMPLADLRYDPLYKEHFGTRRIFGSAQSGHIECQDGQGVIRIVTAKNSRGEMYIRELHRQIGEEWYCYLRPESDNFPLLPSLAPKDGLTVWQKIDGQKCDYLIADKATLNPLYRIDSEGYFWFPLDDSAKRYAWCDAGSTEEGRGLKAFDPAVILWQPAPRQGDTSYPPLLQFPHYSDMQGKKLEFKYEKGFWHLTAAPQLIIAEEQSVEGLRNLGRFLVLEDEKGKKEVLLPKIALNKSGIQAARCEKVHLNKGSLESKNSAQNAFLAYLTMANAVTLEDYSKAMEYLKKAYSFGRYEKNQLQLLGWILNISSVKDDHSASMDAMRLYAAWLVHDNFKRNPLSTKQKQDSSKESLRFNRNDATPEQWVTYWQSRGEELEVEKLMAHYLARRNKAFHSVKLEKILDAQELMEWGMERQAKVERSKQIGKGEFAKSPSITIDWLPSLFNNRGQMSMEYYTRPGAQLSQGFYRLYMLAKSPDPQDRNQVEQIIYGTRYDTHPGNSALRAILQAALEVGEHPNEKGAAKKVVDYVDSLQQDPPRGYGDDFINECNTLIRFLNTFKERSEIHSLPTFHASKKIALATVIPEVEVKKLPDHPPLKSTLSFKGSTDLKSLHQLYENYFYSSSIAFKDSAATFFDVPTVTGMEESRTKFLKRSIQKLNEDLAIGRGNNATLPKHSLKDTANVQKAAKAIKCEIETINQQDSLRLTALLKQMMELAQKPSSDQKTRLQEEANILAGQKPALSESDCIALFLLGDKKQIKQMTHLESDAEIKEFYQAIGDYLLLSRKVDHLEKLVTNLDKLIAQAAEGTTYEELEDLIQEVGDDLNKQQYVEPGKDPEAFLVLEHGLKLYMKKDQVEGLREMLPAFAEKEFLEFPSIYLQRIQGGGKTLIFGHTVALMKADGYHLSIHVPASAQYGTLLYEMQHISGKVFGQKERTLQFDDAPEKFTVEYLNWMKDTFVKAVDEREYINMTIETLRAMRCKYIKTQLVINEELEKNQGIETEKIRDLESCNNILKEMLAIMRVRAIFTFDEVHLAMAPNKELNMPYGGHSHILQAEAQLIGKLLKFSATARSDGKRLLRLAENQQSQQSSEDYEKMIKRVVVELFKDEGWQKNLRAIKKNMTPRELREVKQFILGEKKEIPQFISTLLENPKLLEKKYAKIKAAADQIVLAKQMIAGEWLKERLSKNVEEHHGFSKLDVGPRISIPFIANSTAAEGSEFSDRYIMMANTLIAYLVQGLSSNQVKQLIDDYRKQARDEHLSSEDNRIPLRNTKACKQFSRICKQDLFTLNKDDESQIATVQKTLLAGSKDSIQMLVDHVIAHELGEVEMYVNQVCSHGQNTASMAKARIGYSGSLDNLNMAPPDTAIKPEVGTNGQTIDLLIEKNDDVWAIAPTSKEIWEKDIPEPKLDSLFIDLIDKHPEKDKIRAIIDVGCHFRGVANDDVAKMVCKYLEKTGSSIQGVLYFDPNPDSDKLFFRHKDQSDDESGIPLSDTRPETIEMETGYKPEQLFTHYDQNHITGVDIKQSSDSRAIITWDLDTDIHKALQGCRRLRGLDYGQRLISAVEPGAIPKFYAKLHRSPETTPIAFGKIHDNKILNIKDLVLYSHLKEDEGQLDENLLFCLQKVETVLQQYILDESYFSDNTRVRELFSKGKHLFAKNIAVDLYSEYAHKRKDISIEVFLNNLHTKLMKPLLPLLTPAEKKVLDDQIAAIVEQALDGLKPFIAVSNNAAQEGTAEPINQNRDATMMQFRQQVDKKTAQMESQQQSQMLRQGLTDDEKDVQKNHHVTAEIPFQKEELANAAFAVDIEVYDGTNPCLKKKLNQKYEKGISEEVKNAHAEVWSVNQLLASQNPKYSGLIDEGVLVSSNFAVSWTDRIDMFGTFRKDSFQWLFVCDQAPDGAKKWSLILISIKDAQNLEKLLPDLELGERRMALVRPKVNPKLLCTSSNKINLEELENDLQLKRLMAQAFLLANKEYELCQPKWLNELDRTLPQGKERELYLSLAENEIFRGQAIMPGHPVYKVLKQEKVMTKNTR